MQKNINSNGIIIDEVQNIPEILSYIKTIADQEDFIASKTGISKLGRFIITGSQNILVNEAITQSLAGMVSIFRLLPLSIKEMKNENIFARTGIQTCIYGTISTTL